MEKYSEAFKVGFDDGYEDFMKEAGVRESLSRAANYVAGKAGGAKWNAGRLRDKAEGKLRNVGDKAAWRAAIAKDKVVGTASKAGKAAGKAKDKAREKGSNAYMAMTEPGYRRTGVGTKEFSPARAKSDKRIRAGLAVAGGTGVAGSGGYAGYRALKKD